MRKSYLMLGSLGLVLCGAIMTGSPVEAAAPITATPGVPAQNIREYTPAQGGSCDGSWNNHRQERQRPFHNRNRHERDHQQNCNKCNDGKDCGCDCNSCKDGKDCDNACGSKCDRGNDHARRGEHGRFGSRQCGK